MTGQMNGFNSDGAELPAPEGGDDDFAHEVALTRANLALRKLLRERSKEPAAYSLSEVRSLFSLRA